jgi:YfiH family protein
MTFHDREELRFFTFHSLDEAGVRHAVFTRRGGISRPPYAGLNVGASVGDDPAAVGENRRRIFRALQRDESSAPLIRQVHSDRVLAVREPCLGGGLIETDGMVTDRTDCTLLMRFADCVPILLFDPVRRAAGIAHAGWKGTVAKIAARAVETLVREYGCRPADIFAGIGPSIGPDHYAVGNDVVQAVRGAFGASAARILLDRGSAVHLDLWTANKMALQEAGVDRIECAGICTACRTADWFSHRAENGQTGRFGALIWLG